MSYRGLKVATGLVLALCCGSACGASRSGLIVVHEPIASITWGPVTSLAFSPDGKYLAAAGTPSQSPAPDAANNIGATTFPSVVCWTVADWKPVATTQMDTFYGGDARARELVWAPDSTRLVIYDTRRNQPGQSKVYSMRVSVWNPIDWRILSSANVIAYGGSLAISPDGGSYVEPIDEDNMAVGVWDLRTGSLKFRVNVDLDPAEKTRQPDAGQASASYSSDGKWLAASYGDLVCMINVATRAVVSWRRMPDNVRYARFQPNTRNLLVTYGYCSYRLLAAPGLKPVSSQMTGKFGSVSDVQFSTNGKWFVLGNCYLRDPPSGKGPADPYMVITLVETASMRVFGMIGPVKNLGMGLALSPDGSKVVFAMYGKKVYNGDEGHLFVFPTSKPGEPTPDEWLKAHPGKPAPPPIGRWPRPRKPTATVRPAVPAPPGPTPAPTPTPAPMPAL